MPVTIFTCQTCIADGLTEPIKQSDFIHAAERILPASRPSAITVGVIDKAPYRVNRYIIAMKAHIAVKYRRRIHPAMQALPPKLRQKAGRGIIRHIIQSYK
ncbi:MAG: hypothetical protein NXH74_11940 [Rhodobacteraceae bacterium]|jgi:hypothetical protein|nr:hypothetical protein [Paracoccaceae bacterium]